MEFVKNEKYVSERLGEYSRSDDFPIEGELMVTITLNEYRRLVERLAESHVYNNNYACTIRNLEKEVESLKIKVVNLESENEALAGYNEGLNETAHKLREEIAVLKGRTNQ